MAQYKVIGPPGTGKTRKLLSTVQKYIDQGMSLKNIGYFAFTRKAANEARDRFLADNVGLSKKDLPYFQTLHSCAFKQLGLKEENVMQEEHYKKIGETCGIQITYAKHETNQWNGIFSSDSEYLGLINLAKVKQITPEEQFNLNEHLTRIDGYKLNAISKEITNYKKTYGLIDFNDMVESFLIKGTCPELKVIFVVQNNLIHHAHLYGVKKFIFLGSVCIYPKYASTPVKEEALLTGELEPTNEAYAIDSPYLVAITNAEKFDDEAIKLAARNNINLITRNEIMNWRPY